jgi:hypothetical protein
LELKYRQLELASGPKRSFSAGRCTFSYIGINMIFCGLVLTWQVASLPPPLSHHHHTKNLSTIRIRSSIDFIGISSSAVGSSLPRQLSSSSTTPTTVPIKINIVVDRSSIVFIISINNISSIPSTLHFAIASAVVDIVVTLCIGIVHRSIAERREIKQNVVHQIIRYYYYNERSSSSSTTIIPTTKQASSSSRRRPSLSIYYFFIISCSILNHHSSILLLIIIIIIHNNSNTNFITSQATTPTTTTTTTT